MATVNFDAIIPKFCSEFPNPICNFSFYFGFFFESFKFIFHEYFPVLNCPIRFSPFRDRPSVCCLNARSLPAFLFICC